MRMKLLCWLIFAPLAFAHPPVASGQSHKQPSRVQHVVIKNFQFQPADLTVKTGTAIEWKNDDIVPHTVTADDGTFRSGKIEPGKTWRYTASKQGSFSYTCSPHPNMHGRLTVQ